MNPNIIPEIITASSCGNAQISLSSYRYLGQVGSGTYAYYTDSYTYMFLRTYNYPSEIFDNTFTPIYSTYITKMVPFEAYSGWSSVNPANNPPPTFTATKFPAISTIVFSYDPNTYQPLNPLTDSDLFITDTSITAFASSTKIPLISDMYLQNIEPQLIDLSLFTSLSNTEIYGQNNRLTSLNLKRNKNLKNLNVNIGSNSEALLENNLLGKNFNILNLYDYFFKIPKISSAYLLYISLSSISDMHYITNVEGIKELRINSFSSQKTNTIVVSGNKFNLLDILGYSSIVKNLSVFSNSNLTNLSIGFPSLSSLTLLNSPISSLQIFDSSLSAITIPNVVNINLQYTTYPSTFIDDTLINIDNNTPNYKEIPFYDKFIIYNNADRSTNSDNSFISLLRKDYYISSLGSQFNSKYYVPSKPSGYIPSSNFCNDIIITSPISARNGLPQVLDGNQYDYYTVRFNQLSGIYSKTIEIYNNRDVWKNPNNYFILYNTLLSGWTVVGPLSTSSSIWLSASEGKSFFGDPPSMGWFGPAYTDGGFKGGNSRNPATYGSVFGQSTTVTSTKLLMFSSFNVGVDYAGQGYLGQGQYRYQGDPNTGINQDFYLKDYKFINKMVLANSSNPFSSGKAYLISPIHFTYNYHFPPGWGNFSHPNNTTVRLYAPDGSFITKTALSGIQVTGDLCVGILNSPITSPYTYVHLATSYYCGGITSLGSLSSFIFGPLQSSRFGSIPFIFGTNTTDFCSLTLQAPAYNLYNQTNPWGSYDIIYSFSKALLVSESIAGADSGCGMWVLSGNNTILLGQVNTPGGGPSAYGPGPVNSITRAMTALSQAYSKPVYYPTLAIFDT